MSFLSAAAVAFVVVMLVELPDKTLVATLVLSTRYRPRPVLVGLAAAFAVQCTIAAAAGSAITLLPQRAVEGVVAALFAIGAVLLIRESLSPDDGDVELADRRETLPFWRVVLASFGVLFAAEWGDASQLATAGLVARHSGASHAIATGLGAWLALVGVGVLAAYLGKALVRRVPLHLIHRVAGALFAVFAVLALVAAIRG